jgi:hypothetical protein
MKSVTSFLLFLLLLFAIASPVFADTIIPYYGCSSWEIYPCECNDRAYAGHRTVAAINRQSLIVDNILTAKVSLQVHLINGPQSSHPLSLGYQRRLFPDVDCQAPFFIERLPLIEPSLESRHL